MLRTFLRILLLLALALPVTAEESRRKMVAPDHQAHWDAVGRLNVAGQGYCTATLIAPDLVLTAAHCLASRRTGQRVSADRLHFLAGFRKGGYAVHGRVDELRPAAGYFERGRDTARDIAIVRLSEPVPSDLVTPLPMGGAAKPGQTVSSYSYGRDRSFILSTERDCQILGRHGTLLGTSCEATPGVSGAPLVIETADGPRVVAVIVAMTGAQRPTMRGRALAVAADQPARDRLFGSRLAALSRIADPASRP